MIDWNILEVRFNLLFVSDTCRHKSNLGKGEIDSNFSSGKYITYEALTSFQLECTFSLISPLTVDMHIM